MSLLCYDKIVCFFSYHYVINNFKYISKWSLKFKACKHFYQSTEYNNFLSSYPLGFHKQWWVYYTAAEISFLQPKINFLYSIHDSVNVFVSITFDDCSIKESLLTSTLVIHYWKYHCFVGLMLKGMDEQLKNNKYSLSFLYSGSLCLTVLFLTLL